MLSIHEFDITVIEAAQGVGDWLRPIMEAFSILGATAVYSVIILGAYWCFNPKAGLRLAIMLSVNGAINALFKLAFHEPRAFWVDYRVEAHHLEMTFGMPSGHAQSSLSFWGLLAYTVNRRAFSVLMVLLVLFIGLSRIYLGLHSPTQVLAGFAVGAVVLFLFVHFEKRAVTTFEGLTTRWKIIWSQIIPLGFVLAGVGILGILGNWEMSDMWDHHFRSAGGDGLITQLNLKSIVDSSGLLSGVLLGAIMVSERGIVLTPMSWKIRLLRVLMGVCGLLVALAFRAALLDSVAPNTIPSHVIRYITTTVVGVWAIGFSPLVFRKLNL